MKAKLIFSVFLAFFLVAVFASAAMDVATITVPVNTTHNAGSFQITFNVTNTDPANSAVADFSGSSASSPTSSSISFSPSSVTLAANETADVTATVSFPSYKTGSVSGTIKANSSSTGVAFSVTILSSSTVSLSQTQSASKTRNGTITLTNTGNQQLTNLNLTASGGISLAFSPNPVTAINPGASATVTVSPQNLDEIKFGLNPTTITANNSQAQGSVTFNTEDTFCKNGSIGTNNLSISDIDISNINGDDDNDWMPLNKIKVTVDVDNDADDDIKSVYVELQLFDSDGKKKIGDLEFTNVGEEKIKLGTISDGSHKKATFEFKVTPDLDEGSYKLAIKAYSDNAGEDQMCDDSSSDLDQTVYQAINVDKETDEDKYIAFDKFILSPTEAVCGDLVTLSYSAYNIGDEDQDRVKIKAYSKDLGIDQSDEITSGLEQGDSYSGMFTFTVPQGLSDKTYQVELYALYGYDEDVDVYELVSDTRSLAPIRVFGCTAAKIASISASLDSDQALVGQELKITATISNTQTSNATFTVAAKNYAAWAGEPTLSENTFTLAPGASKQVTLTFEVKDDIDAGEYSFDLQTTSNSETVSKEIAVNIEKASRFSSILPESLKGNTLFWVIGIVNLILIVLIIVVAVRLARR